MGKNSDNARFAKSRGGGGAMRKVMALVLTAALVMSSGISSAFAAGEVQPRTDDSGFTVTVVNGTLDSGGGTTGTFDSGETVSITAGKPDAGKKFDKWTADPSVEFAVATDIKTRFKMLGEDITVTANYTDAEKTTPAAPTKSAMDDEANTYTFTVASGYTDITKYEYKINEAEWADVTENPIKVGDVDIAINSLQIRVKEVAGTSNAGEILKNDVAFTKAEDPPADTYTITATPTTVTFKNATVGYASAPEAETITIKNTGTGAVTLTQPTSTKYTIGNLSTTSLATTDATATFTIAPKTGLTVGTHDETITVSGDNSATVDVSAKFTVNEALPETATLEKIEITHVPTKIEYKVGEKFESDGIEVTATYQDSGKQPTTKDVTNDVTFTPDEQTPLTKENEVITVSYTEKGDTKTVDQVITVKDAPVDKVALTDAITAAGTNKGTATVSVDGSDVEKTAKWVTQDVLDAYTTAIAEAQKVADKTDATAQDVTDAVSALASATGTFDSAKKDGAKAEATPILEKIEIKNAPTKTEYKVGEKFESAGIKVTATYQDSGKPATTKDVTNDVTFTPNEQTPLTVDNKVITVSYTEGKIIREAKQDIKVTAAPKVTYDITATPKGADFADATVGYKAPAAKTITITNVSVTTGNAADVELTQPTGKNYIIGALTNKNPIKGDTSTFTIAPRTGLAAGVYTETIMVSGIGADNTTKVSATVAVTFTVKKASPVEVDKAKLNAAINAANTAKIGITVDNRAASSVGKGVKFVTTAEMNALTTALKTAIAVKDNKEATTGQVNTAEVTLVTATGKFTASIKTGTYTSGGGGGGSSGGGTTPPPATQDRPSDNVGTDGKVDKTETVKEVTNAVADAVKNTTDKTADITIKNAEAITPDALKEIAAAATKAGGAAVLQADTVVDGKIEARLYIDPKLASNIKADIKLGVSLSESSTAATKEKFKNFDNKMAVASFAQQGSFGMRIPVAIKADLTGLNTKTLVFYSYDKVTNKYIPIANTGYYVDKNGFLHFNTTVGGEIIITDKPLAKKK